MRFIQFGDRITSAYILTHRQRHCLLLVVNQQNFVLVKRGFASGYTGEGPRTFSFVLNLLQRHGTDLDEFDVDANILERVDASALTTKDIAKLNAMRPVRPMRWHEYIFEVHRAGTPSPWHEFPVAMPYAIIDDRIIDLALRFFDDPDASLMTGYRRLEDLVRSRSGINEHSAKLFSATFLGGSAKLEWPVKDPSEGIGRGTLFTAVYSAYRNPRAHRDQDHPVTATLTEFLLLNTLFQLEKDAVAKP